MIGGGILFFGLGDEGRWILGRRGAQMCVERDLDGRAESRPFGAVFFLNLRKGALSRATAVRIISSTRAFAAGSWYTCFG